MALTLIEAMASGLPVVATDVGGSHEVVADGKTGVLVPAEDPEALAGALRTLLLDPGMRRAFGDAGRIVAEQRFSVERMARDYAALYDEVLSRRHRESALKVG
jgi:glycosyltransferase involved in cell wall biosynthesis